MVFTSVKMIMISLMMNLTRSDVSGLAHSSSSVQACLQKNIIIYIIINTVNMMMMIIIITINMMITQSNQPWKEVLLPSPAFSLPLSSR